MSFSKIIYIYLNIGKHSISEVEFIIPICFGLTLKLF
jgi:hypothetical protein